MILNRKLFLVFTLSLSFFISPITNAAPGWNALRLVSFVNKRDFPVIIEIGGFSCARSNRQDPVELGRGGTSLGVVYEIRAECSRVARHEVVFTLRGATEATQNRRTRLTFSINGPRGGSFVKSGNLGVERVGVRQESNRYVHRLAVD